jgi:hypothetical protein
VLPVDVLIGLAVVVIGADALALGFWLADEAVHPEVRHRNRRRRERGRLLGAAEPKLSGSELNESEAYDEEWQRNDRERNRRLGTGPNL